MTHQKKSGMFEHYIHYRALQAHRHEVTRGDPRLYMWVMGFKRFLAGEHHGKTKPTKQA